MTVLGCLSVKINALALTHDKIRCRLFHLLRPQLGLCLHQALEAGQEGGEYVDLNGLPGRGRLGGLVALRLLDVLGEVLQHLEAVLERHPREDEAEDGDGTVNDGHTQREGTRDRGTKRA